MKPNKICQLGISRTFQLPRPFLNMSVLKNVLAEAFLRHNRFDEAEKEAREALTFVGLWSKKDVLAKSLTGPGKS